jgi:hypothetical protein
MLTGTVPASVAEHEAVEESDKNRATQTQCKKKGMRNDTKRVL